MLKKINGRFKYTKCLRVDSCNRYLMNACWFQYLNCGAGGAGVAFVHERHLSKLPAVHGWWGNDTRTKFDMKRGIVRWIPVMITFIQNNLYISYPFGCLHTIVTGVTRQQIHRGPVNQQGDRKRLIASNDILYKWVTSGTLTRRRLSPLCLA